MSGVKYDIWLTAESPIVITRNRGTGNQLETLHSIPGTTWRGAMAQAAISRLTEGSLPQDDQDFRALFLEERVRFGHLGVYGARLLPLSTRVCATFLVSSTDHRYMHPLKDLLLLRELEIALPRSCAEGTCEAKLIPYEGAVSIKEQQIEKKSPKVRVTAHTAISNTTLRVREEQFFSATVVERRSSFFGKAWVKDEEAAGVFEKACAESPWLAIGRGRTRGQGHVKLQCQRAAGGDAGIDALEALNRPFAVRGQIVFTVTLSSHCVVYDKWGLARPYLTLEDLTEAANRSAGELEGYELVDWFSRMTTISGWNAQAGLPKTDVAGIAPGSAFLFAKKLDTPPAEDARSAEYERLARFFADAAAGIGERWAEGYGEFTFCDSIHWQARGASTRGRYERS